MSYYDLPRITFIPPKAEDSQLSYLRQGYVKQLPIPPSIHRYENHANDCNHISSPNYHLHGTDEFRLMHGSIALKVPMFTTYCFPYSPKMNISSQDDIMVNRNINNIFSNWKVSVVDGDGRDEKKLLGIARDDFLVMRIGQC